MKALRVLEIDGKYREHTGVFKWQVCFEVPHGARLAVNSSWIDSDLHDWILSNISYKAKVFDQAVWFEDRDEAVLCLMRFSNGV